MKNYFHLRLLLAMGALFCVVACRSVFVGRAGDAYHDGRYLEVAEVLAVREHQFQSLSRRQQVRYATYRGLALMQLNEAMGARKWLKVALRLERAGEPTLPHGLRRRVETTLQTMVPLQPRGR